MAILRTVPFLLPVITIQPLYYDAMYVAAYIRRSVFLHMLMRVDAWRKTSGYLDGDPADGTVSVTRHTYIAVI
jgi:hypothetical protein